MVGDPAALKELRNELRELMRRKHVRQKDLLAKAGTYDPPLIARTTLSHALNDSRPCPSENAVRAIAGLLNLDATVTARLLALRERADGASSEGREPPAETVGTVGATALEVHQAALPGREEDDRLSLTPYLSRPHDHELRRVLTPALAGGPSVLAVLTGDSSTGKTRALYEALTDLAPTHPLLRPATAQELLDLIRSGRITSGTVLWLNETQRFLYRAKGEQAAADLRDLLERQPGIVAVGSLWQSPYWDDLTQQGKPKDPHAQARRLLTGPLTQRIPVPGELTDQEEDRWKDLAQHHQDLRLAYALDTGAADRRIVQHLSGGPELLTAYLNGPGTHFTHIEHALLTAALDARHLGHLAPLPAALLAEAADGALAPHHRSSDPDWAEQALTALSTGVRADDTRTDIRHTLTALTALRARSGSPALYEPADYLDQHTRQRHTERAVPPALWQALTRHTTHPDDLDNLFNSACAQGLYKQAIQLGRKAVLAGSPAAPARLIRLLTPSHTIDPDNRGAHWVASHAVFPLLDWWEDSETINVVRGINDLEDELQKRGVADAVVALVTCSPAVSDLYTANPGRLRDLLEWLREAGADPAADTLVHHVAACANITEPKRLRRLLEWLQEADADQAADTLVRRVAAETDIADASRMAELLARLRVARKDRALAAVLKRDPAANVDIKDPEGIAALLLQLRAVVEERGLPRAVRRRARRQLAALFKRDPAASVNINDAGALMSLLSELRRTGADQEVDRLARRIATDVPLPSAGWPAPIETVPVAGAILVGGEGWIDLLLSELRSAGAYDAFGILADRIATDADITDAWGTCNLLRAVKADPFATRVLLDRVVVHTEPTLAAGPLLQELLGIGKRQVAEVFAERVIANASNLGNFVTNISGWFYLLGPLREVLGDEAADALAIQAAAEADISKLNDWGISPCDLTGALRALVECGAPQAADVLAHRVAEQTDITDPEALSYRLGELRSAGAPQAADSLAHRVAAQAAVTDPRSVAATVRALVDNEAGQAADALYHRAATEVGLTDPIDLAELLRELDEAGVRQAVEVLLRRVATAYGLPSDQQELGDVQQLLQQATQDYVADHFSHPAVDTGASTPRDLGPYGLETDGSPAAPWTWDDVPFPD
ncbi:hypothetical protein ACFV80_37975 [Streptomyces sp. NPDC059862]|uniref:hypothetical protein n=1 Tax=Streptomyces sp. NPDC059862 TaxID=3346975 RepID=UPI003662DD16